MLNTVEHIVKIFSVMDIYLDLKYTSLKMGQWKYLWHFPLTKNLIVLPWTKHVKNTIADEKGSLINHFNELRGK